MYLARCISISLTGRRFYTFYKDLLQFQKTDLQQSMSLATKRVRRIKMFRGMVFITPALGALSTPIVSTKKTASPEGKSEPLR